METKLLLLAIGHFIMAIYFCNPLALIAGEEFCSPYLLQGKISVIQRDLISPVNNAFVHRS